LAPAGRNGGNLVFYRNKKLHLLLQPANGMRGSKGLWAGITELARMQMELSQKGDWETA